MITGAQTIAALCKPGVNKLVTFIFLLTLLSLPGSAYSNEALLEDVLKLPTVVSGLEEQVIAKGHHHHHHRGPRGHRGKRGRRGRRGKTGTSLTTSFGYNYTAPSFNGDVLIIPLAGDTSIPYTVPLLGSASTKDMTFNSGNNSFVLNVAGDYAFDYYISVNSPDLGPSAIMAIRINGTTILPGSYITVGPRYPTDSISPNATGYGHFVATGLPAGTSIDLVVFGQAGLSLDTFASTDTDPAPAQTLAYLGVTKIN